MILFWINMIIIMFHNEYSGYGENQIIGTKKCGFFFKKGSCRSPVKGGVGLAQDRGQETYSVKNQVVNILGLVSHIVSSKTTLLKIAIDNVLTNGHDCGQILDLQKQKMNCIWPADNVC